MNKQAIIDLLMTTDKAIARALVALNERQTPAEQNCQSTIVDNGQGFTGADAMMGTSMADFYTRRGYLSPKQLAYWKKPNVRGVWRICKYAGQLLEIAQAKAATQLSRVNEDIQYSNEFAKVEALAEQQAFLRNLQDQQVA